MEHPIIEKNLRLPMARIIYDLIMADKVIDEKEVEKFVNFFGKESSRYLFQCAQEQTFADAVKSLNGPGANPKDNDVTRKINADKRLQRAETASNIVNEIASSDGFCAPSEAILLLAIEYYLKKNDSFYTKYDIQSFKLTDIFIGKRFVLYTDTSGSSKSCEIEENYDLIVNLLASIGFQFIYIPKLVEHYGMGEKKKAKALEKFKTLAMYIFPDIPENKVEMAYEKIMSMTTKSFVKDYLNCKLDFNIDCPHPSLMVMLGRSSVLGKNVSEQRIAYDTYANFLKINIGNDNIVSVIGDLVKDFNSYVTLNFFIDFNPKKDKLLYHGFHKAFFRLVALAKDNPQNYTINISTTRGAVYINDRKLDLAPGKTAIYLLILFRSFFGDKKGLPMNKVYSTLPKEEQVKLQNQYQWACSLLCNLENRKRSPLYPNVQNRISEIRKSITATVGNNIIGGIIQIAAGDYIKTIVPPDKVTIDGKSIKDYKDWDDFI